MAEDSSSIKLTDFDCIIGDHHLQMLKAALPYLQVSQQRFLSFTIKFQELQRTMSLLQNEDNASLGICSLPEEAPHSALDMLEAIKPYGTTEEQDFIDLVCNFIRGGRIAAQYQEAMDLTQQAAGAPGYQATKTPTQQAASSLEYQATGTPPPRTAFPWEQLKHLLSKEQQDQLEHAMFLMQAIQGFT